MPRPVYAANDAAPPSPGAGQAPVVPLLFRFIRARYPILAILSAAVLAPCFWHRRIEATDLGSHLYNAWLAQLIRHGNAPGLWLATQWNNVLFDCLLSGFAALFGFHAAAKIAVSIAVLIFFWGMFALAAAACGRAPWYLAPLMAVFAFGYTFHMGFFNYYLSLGLSFFGIAVFWRGRGRERFLALALAPLIVLAHPLGLLWLAAACAWLALARIVPPRYHALPMLFAAALLVAVHFWLWARYVVEPAPAPFYQFNGTDQLMLFGARYAIVQWAFAAFAAAALAAEFFCRPRRMDFLAALRIPLELYVLVEFAVPMLPRGIHLAHAPAALALLTDRLTSVSAALLCCALAALRPRSWHLAASLAIAAVFFAFVYRDTGAINRIEAQAETLVRALPPRSRVVGTLVAPAPSRIAIQHIVDRACIGRCFSYGNYEPSTGMFRVRATPGNPVVLADYRLAIETERGAYIVQPRDLPLYQLYQCDQTGAHLCIRSLAAGEANGRLDFPAAPSP